MMRRLRTMVNHNSNQEIYFFVVLSRYALFTGLFWCLISVVFFIIFFDSHYTSLSRIYFFSTFGLTLKYIFVLVGTLLFSFMYGVFLSIPVIMLKMFLQMKLKKRSRHGQKPVFQIFTTKYIPIFVCVLINLFAIFLSFSTIPQKTHNWFGRDSLLSLIQSRIYGFLYERNIDSIYNNWKKYAVNIPQNANIIFMFPEKLLSDNSSFTKTRKMFKNENNWLLFSPTKEAMLTSLLGTKSLYNSSLYVPVPLINDNNPIDSNQKFKSENFIYASGQSAAKINVTFQNESFEYPFSWFSMFLNHFAISQPQLFIFFRMGIPGLFFSVWKWENIVNSNSYLLDSMPKNLSKINFTPNNFVFILPELEEPSFRIFNTIDWGEMHSNQEYRRILRKIDISFSAAIKGLLDVSLQNIVVVPYKQDDNRITFSKGFSNFDFKEKLITSEVFKKRFIERNNKSNCTSMIFENPTFDTKLRNLTLLKTLDSRKDDYPYLNNNFDFSIREKLKYNFFCQIGENEFYIVTHEDEYFANSIKKIKKNNFNLQDKIFIFNDKSIYKKQAQMITKSPSEKDLSFNNFLDQFSIYKISLESNEINTEITAQERESFIKKFGSDLKERIYTFANNTIQ